MSQLAIWNDDELAALRDTRPLPLIVAAKWGFPLQHVLIGGVYRYALQDWVRGLLRGKDGAIREQVRRLLNDPDVTFNVTSENYIAGDGKTYQRPFVTDRDLYEAAQALRPLGKRKQLAEVHAAILHYLTRAGVFLDQVRRDPKRAAVRIEGVVSRKAFLEALAETVSNMPKTGFGVATNDVYQGLFHRDAAQLRRDLETPNPRDKMSIPALHYLGIAEWVCSQHIGEAETLSFDQARSIIQDVAGMIGLQVGEVEQRMGIDLVTGRRLLSAVDAIRG